MLRGGELERSFQVHQHVHDHTSGSRDDDDWDWAFQEVEKELEENPGDVILLGKRAHLLLERRPDEAIGAYRELLKKTPRDPYSRLHLAQALAASGKFDEAMGYAAKLLSEERSVETLELVARIHFERGRFQLCIEFSDEVLSKDPDHRMAQKMKARSLEGLKLKNEATSR